MDGTPSIPRSSGTFSVRSSLPETKSSVTEWQGDAHQEPNVRPGHQTDSGSGWETDDESDSYHGSEDDRGIGSDHEWVTDMMFDDDWDCDSTIWDTGSHGDGDNDSEGGWSMDCETGSCADSQDGWNTARDLARATETNLVEAGEIQNARLGFR